MFFYNLPRFSTDLDFNLLNEEKETEVYERVRKIILKYGKIHDEAIKHYGIILVLDYGIGQRKLKIEISNRLYENHYEIRNFLGLQMRLMVKEDMFAHKLCALLDRTEITSRDVFDCWFFLKERTSVNKEIVESRMGMPIGKYLDKCIESVQSVSEKSLISGLGELTEGEMKNFVRNGLKDELISLLTMFKAFPSFCIMTLNYFRRADKSPVQFSISCLVRRLQSKMVKNHHGQMVFYAYRIGEIVKENRLRQNLTQEELGKRIGVKKSQVSKLERGEDMSLRSMRRVFRALGVTTATLDLGEAGKVTLW